MHVDVSLPLHPLSVANAEEMLRPGILSEGDHVQLLDGVLVEMSPQGSAHAYAIRRLNALAGPVAAAAGLDLSIQAPLDVSSPISLPEPDVAITPVTERDRHPSGALLVVEMGATSVSIDLVRKARIYATQAYPTLSANRVACTPLMGRLLSQKSAIKLLCERGWTQSIGGKHNVKMVKAGQRPITLPKHKGQDYSLGLTKAILKQAGIDRSEL